MRPPAAKLMLAMSCSDWKLPDTRIEMLSRAGLNRSRRTHDVLRLERRNQGGPIDSEGRELLRGELDEDHLVLLRPEARSSIRRVREAASSGCPRHGRAARAG